MNNNNTAVGVAACTSEISVRLAFVRAVRPIGTDTKRSCRFHFDAIRPEAHRGGGRGSVLTRGVKRVNKRTKMWKKKNVTRRQ